MNFAVKIQNYFKIHSTAPFVYLNQIACDRAIKAQMFRNGFILEFKHQTALSDANNLCR
jgi:hypothetical protein